MAEEKITARLRKEFAFLKKTGGVLGILVFGSTARGEKGPRDTDICIVAPGKDSKAVMAEVYRNLDTAGKKYDVFCFEELPLYLKWEVIRSHRVIWSPDEGALYEHFYFFRKLYEDQKHRMAVTKKDILAMLHSSVVHG